jgi:hypothetical protein
MFYTHVFAYLYADPIWDTQKNQALVASHKRPMYCKLQTQRYGFTVSACHIYIYIYIYIYTLTHTWNWPFTGVLWESIVHARTRTHTHTRIPIISLFSSPVQVFRKLRAVYNIPDPEFFSCVGHQVSSTSHCTDAWSRNFLANDNACNFDWEQIFAYAYFAECMRKRLPAAQTFAARKRSKWGVVSKGFQYSWLGAVCVKTKAQLLACCNRAWSMVTICRADASCTNMYIHESICLTHTRIHALNICLTHTRICALNIVVEILQQHKHVVKSEPANTYFDRMAKPRKFQHLLSYVPLSFLYGFSTHLSWQLRAVSVCTHMRMRMCAYDMYVGMCTCILPACTHLVWTCSCMYRMLAIYVYAWYTFVYTHIHVHMYTHTHIYIHILRCICIYIHASVLV